LPTQQLALSPVLERDDLDYDRLWHERDGRAEDFGMLHRVDSGYESQGRNRKCQDFASHDPSAEKPREPSRLVDWSRPIRRPR
jgi:hypothetical protein